MKKLIMSAVMCIALLGSTAVMAQDSKKATCCKAKTECTKKATDKKACCTKDKKECTKKDANKKSCCTSKNAADTKKK